MMDEGYIKFNCKWTKKDLPGNLSVDELNFWRHKLYQQKLIGAYTDGVGYGNISIRTTENNFLITGTATGNLPLLTQKHYTCVTNYYIAENQIVCEGPIKASSESLTHAIIYQLLPEAKVIVHIHDEKLWYKLKDIVPTTAAAVTYGTPLMANEVERLFKSTNLRERKILVMAGHQDGLVSFGKDLAEAAGKFLSLL